MSYCSSSGNTNWNYVYNSLLNTTSTAVNQLDYFQYVPVTSYCAVSPCGKPCHDLKNCRLLNYKKINGLWHIRCDRCNVESKQDFMMCSDDKVERLEYLKWYYVCLSIMYIKALQETLDRIGQE